MNISINVKVNGQYSTFGEPRIPVSEHSNISAKIVKDSLLLIASTIASSNKVTTSLTLDLNINYQ